MRDSATERRHWKMGNVRLAHDLDGLALRVAYKEAYWRGQHKERQPEERRGLPDVYALLNQVEEAIERVGH